MILSKACEYGVKAVICISINSQKGEKISLKQLSKSIESPESFTSKILQKLVRAKLINSVKGANGGFGIEDSQMSKMLLWDIVKEIDGLEITERCVLGMANCSDASPCPIHENYKSIRHDLVFLMRNTSILELSRKVQEGESVLKIEN